MLLGKSTNLLQSSHLIVQLPSLHSFHRQQKQSKMASYTARQIWRSSQSSSYQLDSKSSRHIQAKSSLPSILFATRMQGMFGQFSLISLYQVLRFKYVTFLVTSKTCTKSSLFAWNLVSSLLKCMHALQNSSWDGESGSIPVLQCPKDLSCNGMLDEEFWWRIFLPILYSLPSILALWRYIVSA